MKKYYEYSGFVGLRLNDAEQFSLLCNRVARNKGDKKERVYLLVMTIQAAILVIILVVSVTVQNKYQDISYRYKPIFVTLMAILFLSLIATVYSLGFYKYKNNKFRDK